MIRPAAPSDALEILTIVEDVRRDIVPVIHSVEQSYRWLVDDIFPRGSSYVWVDGDYLLGWVDFHESVLDHLYVRRNYTRLGIGKKLLDFAKSKSSGRLSLVTFQINLGARRFYAREGFVEISFGDGTQNEEGAPDVQLEWRK